MTATRLKLAMAFIKMGFSPCFLIGKTVKEILLIIDKDIPNEHVCLECYSNRELRIKF